MKKLSLLLLFAVAPLLRGADVLAVSGAAVTAFPVTGSGGGTVSAALVLGGTAEAKDPAWAGKVVLVDRGTISFAAKVAAVQEAGGVAVVIADNVASTVPSFSLAPSTANVPVVAVTQAIGANLKTRAGQLARVGPPQAVEPATLPDPKGQAGKILQSDGERYVLAFGSVSIASEVKVGERLSFSVSANGTPPFSYQWIKDGKNLSGATTAVLSISSATLEEAGSYVCQVSNEKGTEPSPAHNVAVKP